MLSKFIDIGTIQIEIGDREDIVIYIEDILKVKIGPPSDIERKIKIIKAMRDSVQGKWTKISYIDVRVPDSPVIKFR
jgi:cell division septal protein FtsQ